MDIRIKSFPNGICVYLNENDAFDDIAKSVEQKFVENRNFFGSKKLCISFSGKELTENQEQILTDIITSVTDIDIVCIVEKKDTDFSNACKNIIEGKNITDDVNTDEDNFILCSLLNSRNQTDIIELSTVKSNYLVLESDTVLIGNVDKDVKIQSNGNLYVLGCINGKINLNNAENYIIALKLNPVYIKIAGFELKKNKSLLSRKDELFAKKVFFNEGKVIATDVGEEDIDLIFKG